METIHVKLLDEGTYCWRPDKAMKVGEDLYQLKGTVPTDEIWEFLPGTVVRVTRKEFMGETIELVAISKILFLTVNSSQGF